MDFRQIRAFLLDLDGTLTVDSRPLPGAAETLAFLKARGYLIRICTNTTTKSKDSMSRSLQQVGLPIEPDEIFSAPVAALEFLRQRGIHTCFKLLSAEVRSDFEEFSHSDTKPESVIIGDVGEIWDYTLMSKLFAFAMDGVPIVALHKGRYWLTGGQLKLDIGAFITGIEYAAGIKALVIGKPSPEFFRMALKNVGHYPGETCMIGDDLVNDVQGSQNCGLKGILVKTGKYRPNDQAVAETKPDLVLESIADLPNFLP